MNKLLKTAAVLGVLVFVGQSCGSGTTSTTNTSNTNSYMSDTSATMMEYNLDEDAAAGDFVHKVSSVELLDEIPESYTTEDFAIIAEPLPADEGFQWVHIEGSVTNNSNTTESLTSLGVSVVDSADHEFSVSTDTTIYVEDGLSPVYIDIQPTQTKSWEGYFMVPKTAEGLKLKVNDLQLLPEAEAVIDLGL
ncbi:MAG: hypothetical protein COW24_00365 [Candidatus Kerfeldbacteria bacterium CG15_BIG_FIL_POST_REV_8_21_14_020_45_12]|uniref:Uncharacterized protein n=1 Tax=Candidatus Kerfeldbacteria bacterium CG15_BIG_FIL_POST_REV_8_21_14_020_45_12 TaxID=2014247 RepID=A0A2M7H579_9BACT|nr:MAG: hypothetical protein COW24_00365 [Candidatus Kerfeldbacteria bacterium CG15_BIG_FIL_POST_REV_8_21_14_020_45_12]PJA92802.1 MAG: hypothetical protein CO132_06035 [Candidatus Kerfeldbacteria bacterium CG_4_9_14_3_um_filter_45_8]